MGQVSRGIVGIEGASGSWKGGYQQYNAILTTTDATATVITSIPVAVGEGLQVEVNVIGMKSDATAAYSGKLIQGFRRQSAGNVTTIGTATSIHAIEDSAGTPAVTFNANTTSQTAEVKVAGISAETWRWEVSCRCMKVI